MVAPVTRATQSLLLTVTGIVLLRMAIGDTFLRYVNEWMRWPLIACGVVLILLAVLEAWRASDQDADHDGESTHVPRAAWLLFAPSLVFFLVAPPALGADFAQRAQTVQVPDDPSEVDLPPLPADDPLPIVLDEVMYRAAYDEGETLVDRRLELTGFVSHDDKGWYVTQFSMSCCAADAFVTQVRASGADAPPDDQWVKVVGTHVAGTGDEGRSLPEVAVESVELIEAPRNQYR